MCQEIISYNSSVLVVNVEIKDYVVVHLSDFIYEPRSNSFVQVAQKKQSIQDLKSHRGKNRISCLGFKVVLDHHCGIFLPYFIAQDRKECYLFCLDSNNEWLLRYKFTIPKVLGKHIQIGDTSYSIQNGPTLIWTVKNEVFIYKAEYSLNLKEAVDDILRLPFDSTCDSGLEVASNISWWKCGDYDQGIIVIKDNQEAVNLYLITIDNVKKKANVVLNRKIIPFPYLAITTCTLVFSENLPSTEDPSDNSCRVFIATTQSQLLEFSNGKYIKHINIPFSCCQRMQVFESPKDELILLCSEEDQVCAVDWMNSKIVKTFVQVPSKVLLDDFLGLGTFQMLLLHSLQHESNQSFDNFTLTDFWKVNVKISESNKKKEISGCTDTQSVEGSIGNVVNALMRKVQATEVSIIECRKEKSEKKSFVKSHCERLCDMLVNGITSPAMKQTPSLAQLVVGQEASRKELCVQHPKMILRSKWQEITNSEWIIGIEIENSGLSEVSDVSLCTVNQTNGILKSSSKLLRPERQIRKREGQTLSSGEKATLVTITTLPNFSFQNQITVNLMLTWEHGENEHQSQFCGVMTLSMQDVLNTSLRNCPHPALYPLKTQMAISLANCNMSNVIELLKSNMETCKHSSSREKYHLRYPLGKTHVSWTCAKNALVMDIFTRDYNELRLCLRLFQQHLPENLRWSPLGKNLALEIAMKSIKNEIRFRMDELDIVLKAQTTVTTNEIHDMSHNTDKESEEMPVKRRKVSQHQYRQTLDSTMCRKTFSGNYSYPCNTDNVFLRLLFYQNKPE